MAFKAGAPRPENAGRKKGSINKRTQNLFDICEEVGCDPFRGLLLIAMNSDKEENRLAAFKELCQYLYPKRAAVQISGNVDLALIDKIEELKQLPDVELKKIFNE